MAHGVKGTAGKPFGVVIGRDDAVGVEQAAKDRRMPAASYIRMVVVERLVQDGYIQQGAA